MPIWPLTSRTNGTNYRPPPKDLQGTQLEQVSSWCRYDPLVCITEVALEAFFIAGSYSALLQLTNGTVPPLANILRFLAVFFVLSLGARMVSDDLGNKLSITAISGIGAKTVSLLAPKFVGW